MKRTGFETGLKLSMVVIYVAGVIAVFGDDMSQELKRLAHSSTAHYVLAVVATCILGGVAGSLNSRLPNYIGRPPLESLIGHLKTPALTALLSLLLGTCIAFLLRTALWMSDLSYWALNASIGLNLGVIAMSLWTAGSLVSQYREMCKWEDSIPPHQRGF